MIGRLMLRRVQVAALLDMTYASLSCALPGLRARGFPEPVPGSRGRYDPRAIEAWLARPRGEGPRDPQPPVEDLAAWQAELDRRLGPVRH